MSYEMHNFVAGELIRASAINEMDAQIKTVSDKTEGIQYATNEEILAITTADI